MASSSSGAKHFTDQTSNFSRQTEPEMKSSKIRHWSNLSYNSSTSSEWSAETNLKEYNLLKKHPEWGRFFRSFETLELGKKISGGAQADVYEARTTSDGPFNLVAKVMKGDAPLQAFQRQWPIGMLSAYNSEDSYVFDLPLMTILGGTLLEDERLKGRFAFVMYRRWGDLRLLIDRRMKLERSTAGPFFMDQAIQLMLRIAEDMEGLHKHYILHRDLKASNVLVWGEFGDDTTVIAPSEDDKIGSVVADFECSVGVLGTGLWRAPEILQQLRGRVSSLDWEFTHASDVYSYGMTCYEIVSGHVPFEDSFEVLSAFDAIDEVLSGRRPNLPDELPLFLRSIILSCWQSDPKMRPSFNNICRMLKDKQGCDSAIVVVDNESNKDATIVKVEQWDNHRTLPLPQALERLLQMQLWVSKYVEYSQTKTQKGMIVQCFEVRDGEGRKVSDKNLIANIVKVLSLPVKYKLSLPVKYKLSLPVKMEGIVGISHYSNAHSDAVAEMYLIQITSKMGAPPLLERLLLILKEMNFQVKVMNFQVFKPQLWSHSCHFEGAIFVKGSSMNGLIRHFYEDEDNITELVDSKMVLEKLASEDANLDLQNVQHYDLRAPRKHAAIRVLYILGYPSHMAVKVVCLDNRELLVNMACNLVNRIREDQNLKGAIIHVQKFKKEGVNGSYFYDDNDDRKGRFKDFVKIFFKRKWDKWDTCLNDFSDLMDFSHSHEGKLELVFNLSSDYGFDYLMQNLSMNGLYISKALREPHGNDKVLVTFFVSSENK